MKSKQCDIGKIEQFIEFTQGKAREEHTRLVMSGPVKDPPFIGFALTMAGKLEREQPDYCQKNVLALVRALMGLVNRSRLQPVRSRDLDPILTVCDKLLGEIGSIHRGERSAKQSLVPADDGLRYGDTTVKLTCVEKKVAGLVLSKGVLRCVRDMTPGALKVHFSNITTKLHKAGIAIGFYNPDGKGFRAMQNPSCGS